MRGDKRGCFYIQVRGVSEMPVALEGVTGGPPANKKTHVCGRGDVTKCERSGIYGAGRGYRWAACERGCEKV